MHPLRLPPVRPPRRGLPFAPHAEQTALALRRQRRKIVLGEIALVGDHDPRRRPRVRGDRRIGSSGLEAGAVEGGRPASQKYRLN